MLGITSLMVDREERIGDNWRTRYHQLVLHDPIWFDHLPYLPFPSFWPVFTPKDKIGDWFESYVKLLELNAWTETTISKATWDESAGKWTVALDKTAWDDKAGKWAIVPDTTRVFHPKVLTPIHSAP
jgi:cation diffusion facilitator CzcD-associated flavoprotein CzcO